MSEYTVKVTAEDIAEGVRRDCDRCAVALAVKRAVPGAKRVSVGPMWMHVWKDGVEYRPDTPAEAEAFINDFDEGEPVEPFEFPLVLHEVAA